MKDTFHRIAARISTIVGTPGAFLLALFTIVVWSVTGPMFQFSDTWQLVINTGTTIVTFLMVFLIQNTQNRDAKAMQLKLDELIRANKNARNLFVDLEDLKDDELTALDADFKRLHETQLSSRFMQEMHKKIAEEQMRRHHFLSLKK